MMMPYIQSWLSASVTAPTDVTSPTPVGLRPTVSITYPTPVATTAIDTTPAPTDSTTAPITPTATLAPTVTAAGVSAGSGSSHAWIIGAALIFFFLR